MAKQNRVSMPMSGAGITRYFDESESKFKIQPVTVLLIIAFFVIVVFMMHLIGGGML